MSAHTRTVFRQKLAGFAAPTPYFETIATPLDLNTAPDLWVSLEFPPVTAARVSLGYPACMRETGFVVVHVLGRSGVGDAVPVDFADFLIPFFDQPYIADVRLTGVQPLGLGPTDIGEWVDVTFQVGYTWDYVVNRVATI